MLYSLIPPILVVTSLIGIIIFLFKKAHKVAEISSLENIAKRNVMNGLNSGSREEKSSIGSEVRTKGLIFLEKMVRKIRVVFLRLENMFTTWSESLKEKRKIRVEKSARQASLKKGEIDIIDKVNSYNPERKEEIRRIFQRRAATEEKKEPMRPLLREKVIEPESRVETKNQLENILIDRIAANPKDTEAYERLGEYYLEIGNYEHSKECYKQVMKLNPRNIGARSRMKRLERLLGR